MPAAALSLAGVGGQAGAVSAVLTNVGGPSDVKRLDINEGVAAATEVDDDVGGMGDARVALHPLGDGGDAARLRATLADDTGGGEDGIEEGDELADNGVVDGGTTKHATRAADVVAHAMGDGGRGGAGGGGADADGASASDGRVEEQVEGEGDGGVLRVGVGEERGGGGEGNRLVGRGRWSNGHTAELAGRAASGTTVEQARAASGGGGRGVVEAEEGD